MTNEEIYERREQTRVKHVILRQYLERFAHIVGSRWESITYVDGFAGPWNVRSPDLKDSSFSIALDELRKARDTHAQRGKQVQLRCFFLEQDREAFGQLEAFAARITDAEVKVRNAAFEDSIQKILEFIQEGGKSTFPFIFIDPTGWTGFALQTIRPLLRLNPGEVLINFMTGHIHRFLTEGQSQQSFMDLFDFSAFRERLEGHSGIDLDDEACSLYMERVESEGRFRYVLPAIVLHPEKDQTHFHLVYATRHPRGVEVFKEAEKRAMAEMEQLRAGAQKRRREERTLQSELPFPDAAPESQHYRELRERYLDRARQELLQRLVKLKRIPYEEAWSAVLKSPLVWESDLKSWIDVWRREHKLHIDGLEGRERVPARERSHYLVWLGDR